MLQGTSYLIRADISSLLEVEDNELISTLCVIFYLIDFLTSNLNFFIFLRNEKKTFFLSILYENMLSMEEVHASRPSTSSDK